MKKIEVYELATEFDPAILSDEQGQGLVLMDALFDAMATIPEYFELSRYQLNTTPVAFKENKQVAELIAEKGNEILPLLFVDGELKKSTEYPTLDEFSEFTEMQFVVEEEHNHECCGGHGHQHDEDHECCGGHHHHHDENHECQCENKAVK